MHDDDGVAPNANAPSARADRNLLFGIIALQTSFVTREQLLAAFDAWVQDKSKTIAELLECNGALPSAQRDVIEKLVGLFVEKHGGDAEKSLAALASASDVRRDLERLNDPDLTASLGHVGQQMPSDTYDYSTITSPHPSFITSPQPSLPSRFRVLRLHAKGGLGQVSVALDQDLNREVALKEIQPQHADNQISRERFVLEAEITGGLEHPGIVPVYALGQAPDGRPFYAMRFVKGDSLKEALERYHKLENPNRKDPGARQLALRQLLGRFIDVCNAMEYAHSRGVLHRDLKPGNIMVGKYGETLVVDWGLAKVGGKNDIVSDEASLRPSTSLSSSGQTQPGSAVGTPAYMSPEQAAGRLEELGPATDIYGLGATLYHSLTGRPPFTGSVIEVLPKVLRGEFPAPHTLNPDVPLALDAICMKAMAVKPSDRFASARSLADDIEHWLADEAVTAHRERLSERAGRWLRRHRAAARAAALALVVISILSSVAALLVDAARRSEANQRSLAESNEQRALQAQAAEARRAEAERAANEKAQRRLAQIEKGNEILGSVFADLNPSSEEQEGKSLRVLLGERLDRATDELDGEAIGDKLMVAKLQDQLGTSQLGLGYPEKAIELFSRARATFTSEAGLDDPNTLLIMFKLAVAYREVGKLELAVALGEETLALQKSKLGPDHRDTIGTMAALGGVYMKTGKLDAAFVLLEEALELSQAALPRDDSRALDAISALAFAFKEAGKPGRAMPLYQESLERLKAKFGPAHSQTLNAMTSLASAYSYLGKFDLAIPLLEDAAKLQKIKLGDEHPRTLATLNNLAQAYSQTGKADLAIPLLKGIIQSLDAKFGPGHPDALRTMGNLAEAYNNAGKPELAIPLLNENLKSCKAKLGLDHPDTLAAMTGLAETYKKTGKFEQARSLYEEALGLIKIKLGPDDPRTLTCMGQLAQAYLAERRLDLALPIEEETLKLTKAKFGPEYMETLLHMHNLAFMYSDAQQFEKSIALYEEELKLVSKKYGADNSRTLLTVTDLGVTYRRAGRYADAISLLERAWHSNAQSPLRWVAGELLATYVVANMKDEAITLVNLEVAKARGAVAANSPQLARTIAALGAPLLEVKAFSEAEPLLRESLAIREAQEPDVWTTSNSRSLLGGCLLGLKNYAAAEPFLRSGYDGLKEHEADIPPQGKIRLTEALERLVRLYDDWEKMDQAEEWRKRLNEARASAGEIGDP